MELLVTDVKRWQKLLLDLEDEFAQLRSTLLTWYFSSVGLESPRGTMYTGWVFPIFWDAPYSYIHASTDIGEVVDWIKGKFSVTKEGNKYLAVLHNRNKMVNAFASRYYASAMVSAKCSAKIHVKCVAVWITFPLCASGLRLVARI